MNSTEIFGIASGINRPWYIEKVAFGDSSMGISKELHLFLNFERSYKFEDCNGVRRGAHDTVERMWQHLKFFQHSCSLHARIPRIKSSNGILEDINSKIELAKRRTRGYHTIDNLINMMYYLSAKLKFEYPLYSL